MRKGESRATAQATLRLPIRNRIVMLASAMLAQALFIHYLLAFKRRSGCTSAREWSVRAVFESVSFAKISHDYESPGPLSLWLRPLKGRIASSTASSCDCGWVLGTSIQPQRGAQRKQWSMYGLECASPSHSINL